MPAPGVRNRKFLPAPNNNFKNFLFGTKLHFPTILFGSQRVKTRKKLIARKRECSARVGRSRAGDCGRVMCVRSKDLRFIGREFHKRGEELLNDQSAKLSLVETVGRERHR